MTALTDEAKTHLRHVQLNTFEMKFLEYVAERAGEVPYNYNNSTPPVTSAIKALVEKKLLEESYPSPIQYPTTAKLRLTDQGRAIVDYLDSIRVGRT